MKISEIKTLANFGDADCQFLMGFLSEHGMGMPRSGETAKYWYKISAEQGSFASLYSLSILYADPKNSYYNENKSKEFCIKAAEGGYAPAQWALGNRLSLKEGAGSHAEEDWQSSLSWMKRAADQDFGPAIVYLADLYDRGEGVEKNSEMAARFMERAERTSYSPAEFLIGVRLIESGNDADTEKGLQKILKAAASGNYFANLYAARLYRSGDHNITKNVTLAEYFESMANFDVESL